MKRRLAFMVLILPLAASAPAQRAANTLEAALAQAKAEQRAADAETAKLEQAAAAAKGEAQRLQAQQAAAAQALEAAEARITAAEAQYRLAAAQAALIRARLSAEQRPVSSLLAGLATMARRPPLLAIADRGSVDDFVEVSTLLDSTLPAIRARTRALSAELARGQQLEASALAARSELMRSRGALAESQKRFAALQQKALERALASGGQALSAGDSAIAAAEQVERLNNQRTSQLSAAELGRLLAALPPAPPRPMANAPAPSPFAYRLPVSAPVISGVGSVDDSGVRARGISFATARGAEIIAPAGGIVRYSGPFRDYDGLVILDHGHGWLTVLVNVASPMNVGDRVEMGDPLGRALGPVQLQLSANGRFLSPAIMAGSSGSLSNHGKGS